MDKIRTLTLDDIQMPVIIEHADMAIPDQGRIDHLPSRVDTLAIRVHLKYRGADLKKGSHHGVFNYMGLYNHLCFSPVRTLTGPLEGVLDETIGMIETLARASGIDLVNAQVTARRLGLVVGAPELKSLRSYTPEPQLKPGQYRSAGICQVPLQVRVDHLWSDDAEHSKGRNLFPETVKLAFSAISPAQPLAQGSLEGLYNYIETYKLADAAQDMIVDGPFEIVAEKILADVLRDAGNLKPAMLSVSIERSGYARCRPTLGVEGWI